MNVKYVSLKAWLRLALYLAVSSIMTVTAHAGWLDFLNKDSTSSSASNSPVAPQLSTDDIASGLKQALGKGTEAAIASLSKPDGFLKNLDVKIPVPESLSEVEKGLRAVGQEKYTDEFVATMNHGAESAVTECGPIFSDAIQQMTVADAKQILTGPDDSATQYFRKVGEARIKEKMLPLVKAATEKAGVTAAYKNFMSKVGPGLSFLHPQTVDIDEYVTQKASDGLFKMIAVQEKEIRQNPAARTTDLLKKVFGTSRQ
jgi:uncharacterized protein DUF4197